MLRSSSTTALRSCIGGGCSLLAVWLLLCHLMSSCAANDNSTQLNQTLRRKLYELIRTDNGYDKNIPPTVENGTKPVTVNVFFHVQSIRDVCPKTMKYSVRLLYREQWTDERLAFFDEDVVVDGGGVGRRIWKPDTYFPNAIESDEDTDEVKTLLRLSSRGIVLWGRRISMTAECPMDLSLYPFDEQICQLQIESYGLPVTDMTYQWKIFDETDGTGSPKDAVNVVEYNLPDLYLKRHKKLSKFVKFETGNYTRLVVCFVFARSKGYFFVQLFIPAAAVVMTSWFTIWMRNEATFSDMINLMLTITLLYFSYNTLMPAVSYIKAMDLYLLFCFLQVVLALIKTSIMRLLMDWGYLETFPPTSANHSSNQQHDGAESSNDVSEISMNPRKPSNDHRNENDKDQGRHLLQLSPQQQASSFNNKNSMGNVSSQPQQQQNHHGSAEETHSIEIIKFHHKRLVITRENFERFFRIFGWALPIAFGLFCAVYFAWFLIPLAPTTETQNECR